MRKVEFEQGSDAWLTWRKGLLTATDAPMLLGHSPYVTPYKGWQRKVGQAEEQKVNSAMLRGQTDEPRARKMFIDQYGINMTPCCIESDLYNYLGASLDGISDCGEFILEIKSQNISAIRETGIPEFHMDQMQHQLLCTDNIAKMCYYVTIWGNEIHTIEVYPDAEWRKNYHPKAKEFWKGVVFFDAPPLSNRDYKDMNGLTTWMQIAEGYKKICNQIKNLEDEKEYYRTQLINLCGQDSCSGGGVKVLNKMTKGRVNYQEVLNILNVPNDTIEQYRKPTTFSWTIMLDQKTG